MINARETAPTTLAKNLLSDCRESFLPGNEGAYGELLSGSVRVGGKGMYREKIWRELELKSHIESRKTDVWCQHRLGLHPYREKIRREQELGGGK